MFNAAAAAIRFALKSNSHVALLSFPLSPGAGAQLRPEYLISQLRLKTFPVASSDSFRPPLVSPPLTLSLSLGCRV